MCHFVPTRLFEANMICWCMRRGKDERFEATARTACRLHWQVARQCDGDVVKAIALGKELDAVYSIDYVGLFTEFFEYMRLIGVWEELKKLKTADKERFLISTQPYVLIYIQKLIAGLASGNAAEEVLLTNQGAMRVVGFNACQVEEGICRRGRHRRKKKKAPGRPVGADSLNENADKVIVFLCRQYVCHPAAQGRCAWSCQRARRAHLTARSYIGILASG